MDKQRILFGIVTISGMFMPIIGLIIGAIRYRKNKDNIKAEIHEEYLNAQARGGISSLYYKHEGKRLFTKTFGTPVLIFFLVGLAMLYIGFGIL